VAIPAGEQADTTLSSTHTVHSHLGRTLSAFGYDPVFPIISVFARLSAVGCLL